MPASGEYKSALGLRDLYYALVTQDDSSAYAAGSPALVAPLVSVSQTPASNSVTQYADDGPYDVLTSEGETKIDLETTNIPIEIQAILLGKKYDASTGRMFDHGGTPPDVALSFRSIKSNGKYRYYQFLKGKFSSPSEEQSTKTDSPEPKTTKISYTAVKTTRQFSLPDSVTDGAKVVKGDEDAANFSGATWFSSVQVPVVGSPAAFTCTPSPADGATGVAVSVVITLTFNHALAGNAENGIMLLRTSTAAPITVTRTINAARTVVTLTPSANLAAAAAHMIVVPTAVSIYGQALANSVYDFTTA